MPNVSWDDIGGLDNVKRELQEVSTVWSLNCVAVAATCCPYLLLDVCEKKAKEDTGVQEECTSGYPGWL